LCFQNITNVFLNRIFKQAKQLLNYSDEEIVQDACWTLAYMSDGPDERNNDFIKSGVCTTIVNLLSNGSPNIQTACIRFIGNIVSGNYNQTQYMLNLDALPKIKTLLNGDNKLLVREATWAISNISAGDEKQIQALIDGQVFPIISGLLKTSEYEIIRESLWSVSNASSSASAEQIYYMAEKGCLEGITSLIYNDDINLVKVAVEGIYNFLKSVAPENNIYANWLESVQANQQLERIYYNNKEDKELCKRIVNILETYYPNSNALSNVEINPNDLNFDQGYKF